MQESERSEFVAAYARLLMRAWSDEGFMSRLRADPQSVLPEAGLTVPPGTNVEIRDEAGADNLDQQVEQWESGVSSGHVTLNILRPPQVDAEELSDLEELPDRELSRVVGGTGNNMYCYAVCLCFGQHN